MADKATPGTPQNRGKGANLDNRKPAVKRDRVPREQTVVVSHIPPAMTNSDLQHHFKPICVNVSLNRPRSDPTVCYVEFETAEQAKKALALAPPEKDGQKAKVAEHQEVKACPQQHIVVKHIPKSMDHADIRQHYSGLGDDAILSIKRATKTVCFVSFKSIELAKQAASMAPPAKDGVQTVVEPVDVQCPQKDDALRLTNVPESMTDDAVRQHYEAVLGKGTILRYRRVTARTASLEFQSAQLRSKAAAMEPPRMNKVQAKVQLSEAARQEAAVSKVAPPAEAVKEAEAPVERPKKKMKKFPSKDGVQAKVQSSEAARQEAVTGKVDPAAAPVKEAEAPVGRPKKKAKKSAKAAAK